MADLLTESLFLEQWKNDMTFTMKQMNPDWEDDEIKDVLDEMIREQMTNPVVTMDNNYTGENKNASLLSVWDWTMARKPIIAGNGTFYKNQHEAINPVATMLIDKLSSRKNIKNEMFAIEDTSSDEYKDKDRAQLDEKTTVNSYYGGSGMESSAFYSKWSAPATTLTAQSVISTTETTFEAFLGDNFKFIDVNECFHWMNSIIEEEDNEVDDFIVIPTLNEVVDRIKSLFLNPNDCNDEVIYQYLCHLSKNDLTRIFYKNQLLLFVKRHEPIKDIIRNIFLNTGKLEYEDKASKAEQKKHENEVNHNAFLNPNSPPKSIQKYLDDMNRYFMKYVYVSFLQIDKMYRLKHFKRNRVVIVDTDSNILALDFWVNFCMNEVLDGAYGNSKEHNGFIMVNTLTYTITAVVQEILETYGEHSNIPEEYRGRFNMKNEFFFQMLAIGLKKKRYLSAIKLREGNLNKNATPDCKGFEYMKASTSDEAKAFFDGLVKKYILSGDIPDVVSILRELRVFEQEIINSIKRGEKTYLPIANAKEIAAYKFPYREQGVRGAIAWNILYPSNMIEFPSKVSILKLKIFNPIDVEKLKAKEPEIYDKIINEIFGNKIEDLAKKGLQVIAVPANVLIPEWLLDYIDWNTMVNSIVGQFKGVLDIFGCLHAEVGKTIQSTNRQTNKFSNIVHF